MPIEEPSTELAQGAAATRIGLLLPLGSGTLGPPAEALRAGFMAAYAHDGAGFTVTLVNTGDSPEEALEAYSSAIGQNDIIVGPLARTAVGAVAASTLVSKPTVALNHPEVGGSDVPLPSQMLMIGLSIEDEARQVAAWAAAEQTGGKALVLSGPTLWQRRIATAFDAQWTRLGRTGMVVELPASDSDLSDEMIAELRARIAADPPDLLFAALEPDQLRQVRAALGTELPCYGTSSVNPGREPGMHVAELDGVRLLDLPWEVQSDHPAAMLYPRLSGSERSLDLDRLYALGIDAFRVARELALHPNTPFRLDGVTGRLAVGIDGAGPRFQRSEPAAVYQAGAFELVTAGP
jgi:outer membrane PBP1 activator LpoA protein